MLHLPRFLTALTVLALSTLASRAADAPDQDLGAAQRIVDSLKFQQGHIVLKEGLASLNVPEAFRYLPPKDAEIVLHKLWGNPPGTGGLGMLFPAEVSPLDANSWGVVLSWAEDGYVKDDDAAKIDYSKILKQMQEDQVETNKRRKEAGYEACHLVGWAQPPHYEQATHKIYWAKELDFEGTPMHTLNYDIRMLGRRGVLQLSVVSSINQLAQVEQAVPSLLEMVDFQPGHRYTDFKSGDKVATYGLAALVTGGILAKAGFFKGIFLAILAGKKFVVMGVVALVAFLKRLFGGKNENA